MPFLTGSKSGDAHDCLYWLNNEPGDAVRRHLIAVRREDWRLYRKYEMDPWQLFDLKQDPHEQHDLAADHPNVVQRLAARHAEWAASLVPVGKIPKIAEREPVIPNGHGWATP